jgi:serine/threonine protein kinase
VSKRLLNPMDLRHDRVAARAAWLVRVGRLDRRDLRQLLPRYGSWILGSRIGGSRHNVVHRAIHAVYDWEAAVKLGDIRHEASVLKNLRHPRIVPILDAGDDYLVMGLARKSLRDHGRIHERRAIRLAKDVARALQALHRAGWIHGDVKPGNILLADKASAWLSDFGTACRLQSSTLSEVRGSWPYLAPECFHGEKTPRSDFYSLGLTLHESLSGMIAVPATNFRDARRMHHDLILEPLHWIVPNISRRLSKLIQRLCSKHPEDRPANAAEILEELQAMESEL